MYFTDKQIRILNFIRDHIDVNNRSPSLSEIAHHFGVSTSTVHEHIKALQQKKALRRSPYRTRSIELLDTPPAPRSALTSQGPILGRINILTGTLVQSARPSHTQQVPDKASFTMVLQGLPNPSILAGAKVRPLMGFDPLLAPTEGNLVLGRLDRRITVLARYSRSPEGLVRLQPLPGSTPLPHHEAIQIEAVATGLQFELL